jgi:hypothetical protein
MKEFTTNEKLEVFRKVHCLGLDKIKSIFPNNDHIQTKYCHYREEYGQLGNFMFLFCLDEENAKKVLDKAGF